MHIHLKTVFKVPPFFAKWFVLRQIRGNCFEHPQTSFGRLTASSFSPSLEEKMADLQKSQFSRLPILLSRIFLGNTNLYLFYKNILCKEKGMICQVSLLWQDTIHLVRCHDIVYFLATRNLAPGRKEERNYLELRSWQTIFSFSSFSCTMHQGFGKRFPLPHLLEERFEYSQSLKCIFFFVSKGKYKDGSAVLTGQGEGRENLFCQGLPGKNKVLKHLPITRIFESFFSYKYFAQLHLK